MRTPAFWAKRGPKALLLWPLTKLYKAGRTAHVRYAKPLQAYIPVICIGNAVAGGAGKTPTALAIGQILKDKGVNAYYLTRGYGGSLKGPLQVTDEYTAREVGDEPILLSRVLPTIISRDRKAGAIFAEEEKAECIVMDDGFQNPSLLKDLSLLVIDTHYGFGNGFLLPAGPLREPLDNAFDRADAFVLISGGTHLPKLPEDRPVLTARIVPSESAHRLDGQKVLSFCGIANPDRFFALVETLGGKSIENKIYGDHAFYEDKEIVHLSSKARALGALLVTTRKDAARISPDLQPLLTVVDIELVFDDPDSVAGLLLQALEPPPAEEPAADE